MDDVVRFFIFAEDAPEEGAWVAACPLHVLDRPEQHPASAAGRVVDALALPRIEQIDHHPHHAARRVEFARLLAPRDVGELADQILVGIAQDVGPDRSIAQRHAGQPLHEVLEQLIAEHLTVPPVGGAKDSGKGVWIGPLDASHGPRQRGADVGRYLTNIAPTAPAWQDEAVQLREVGEIDVAVGLSGLGGFLVPDIADALEEQQWEDVALPVGPVDGAAAQNLGTPPKLGLQVLQGQLIRQHGPAISYSFSGSASTFRDGTVEQVAATHGDRLDPKPPAEGVRGPA